MQLSNVGLVKLLGYDYEIEYKRGKEKFFADALSLIEGPKILMVISHPIPHWLEHIQEVRLEKYLLCLTSSKPKEWVTWLSWVEYILLQR